MARILVVDDEPGILTLLRTILRVNGHEVFTASNSVIGLELLSRTPFDVLLLDLRIGDADGRDFYRSARALDFRGAIVIISAYGALRAARELGADGAISKPFAPNDLMDELDSAIRKTQARLQAEEEPPEQQPLFRLVRPLAWA
jgi:DNA-binding response OmpR family regulator